jgi:hypothetical protein
MEKTGVILIEKLPELVNNDEALVRRGRFLTAVIKIVVGDDEYWVGIKEGRVVAVERGPFLMRSCDIAVRASAEAWEKFWERYPPPGYQDIFGMSKSGEADVSGDWLLFMQNLQYFKDLLQSPRRLAAEEYNA